MQPGIVILILRCVDTLHEEGLVIFVIAFVNRIATIDMVHQRYVDQFQLSEELNSSLQNHLLQGGVGCGKVKCHYVQQLSHHFLTDLCEHPMKAYQ